MTWSKPTSTGVSRPKIDTSTFRRAASSFISEISPEKSDSGPEMTLTDSPIEKVEASIVAGADGEPQPLDDDFDPAADVESTGDETLDREQLGAGAGDVATPASARKPSRLRLVNFVRACAAELQRVQWPDRRQTGQATAVVLGFVVIAGAFLGLADTVAQQIIDIII